MIKSIKVTNEFNESLTLELANPDSSGLAVLSVDGLGPPKATINTTNLATSDGSVFNSARAQERNILMTLKFMWDETIEDARQKSYRYFRIKSRIKLTIETTNRTLQTYGRVESNEPTIFSKFSGTQISIICQESYLSDIGESSVTLAGVVPLFEFPFSNESLEEDLIVLDDAGNADSVNIVYEGDANVGIDIYIHANDAVNNLGIYNPTFRQLFKIDSTKLIALTGSDIITGDDIHISTKKGEKSITLTRAGEEINIFNTIVQPIPWFELQRGDNVYTYIADSGKENVEIEIKYRQLYEGV